MRDFDVLLGEWDPAPLRRSPASDILHHLYQHIAPDNWIKRSLHGHSSDGGWAGCLLGHIEMLYSARDVRTLVHHNRDLAEAVEALALVALRAQTPEDWREVWCGPKRRGDWNPNRWCGLVASYNDSVRDVNQIHHWIDDAIRHLFDIDLRPHHDMHQRHVMEGFLEEKAKLAMMMPPLVAISESGEYPPISSKEEDLAKVVSLPAWDADAEFAELLSMEPVAA